MEREIITTDNRDQSETILILDDNSHVTVDIHELVRNMVMNLGGTSTDAYNELLFQRYGEFAEILGWVDK